MTEQETSQWSEIVRHALQKYYDLKSHGQPCAAPGAPLKPLVLQLAAEKGVEYPPPEFQNKKFSDFLMALPGAVLTQRRLGQDLLVVPAGRLDLFETSTQTTSETPNFRFRPDVFKAFTTILPGPDHRFWYVKDQDSFVEKTTDSASEEFVPVEFLTLEDSIRERQAFVDKLQLDTDTAKAIVATFSAHSGILGGFSAKIKELRLDRQWYQFRAEIVHKKLQAWAATHNIAFSPSWLEKKSRPVLQETISSRETNAFLAGLMQLGPEDAKRVLVPLDIVLKVLRRD